MPRSSRGSSSRSSGGSSSFGRRGASTVASPPPSQQQHRAAPPAPHQAPVPQQQVPSTGGGGGFLSNVMGTAAGVGMGSVIGHGVSNALFGGSGSRAVEQAPEQPQSSFQQEQQPAQCSIQAKDFTQCLSATNNDVSSCQYYLDQLKACQQMASQH